MNERKITRWREEVKSVKGADKASRVKVSRKFPFANIFGRQTLENNLESNFHSRFSIALTNPNVLTKSSSQKEKKKKNGKHSSFEANSAKKSTQIFTFEDVFASVFFISRCRNYSSLEIIQIGLEKSYAPLHKRNEDDGVASCSTKRKLSTGLRRSISRNINKEVEEKIHGKKRVRRVNDGSRCERAPIERIQFILSPDIQLFGLGSKVQRHTRGWRSQSFSSRFTILREQRASLFPSFQSALFIITESVQLRKIHLQNSPRY